MRRLTLAVLGTLLLAAPSFAGAPWLPAPGQYNFSPSFTYSSFDEFWRGEADGIGPGADGISQRSFSLGFDVGLAPGWAVDGQLGYTQSTFTGADDLGGLDDVRIGLRRQLWDQSDWENPDPMSVALRVGGIVAGSYDVTQNTPHSPGDGASGAEVSLGLGYGWDSGAWSWANGGYRLRSGSVPNDFFGSVGAGVSFLGHANTSVGLNHTRAVDGTDIGDPDFQFVELREVSTFAEWNLGWSDGGGRNYGFSWAHAVAGRNTGKADVFRTTLSWSL